MPQPHLKYALDVNTNQMVGVEFVPNGLKCGCVCPHCQEPLVAKNAGARKEHHFAHCSGADCAGARMTALHKLAQQIISQTKTIMLPPYEGECYKRESESKVFNEIDVEKEYDIQGKILRPDCVGVIKSSDNKVRELWIEILVTHEVDETKKNYIKEGQISCIEIDLADLLNTDYSEESVKKRLQEERLDRYWINCPICDKRDEQAKEEQKRKEEEKRRQKEIAHQQRQNKVIEWFKVKDDETANIFIQEITNNSFYKNPKQPNDLLSCLVPSKDFLEYINKSPKTESALKLYYTLLRFYYKIVVNSNFQQIIEQINYYRYKKINLTPQEQITFEELVSLRILYLLKCRQSKYYNLDFENRYQTVIKKYLKEQNVRNKVLMVASVFYHHIIGSNAHNFGELTQEIIQQHLSIARVYFTVINSQDKYPNDYTLDNRNMLDCLIQYINNNNIVDDEDVGFILRECYSFAFQAKTEEQVSVNVNNSEYTGKSKESGTLSNEQLRAFKAMAYRAY